MLAWQTLSTFQKANQRLCVIDRISVVVVIEVGPDLLPGCVPLAEPVSPPAQGIVRVGAGIEVRLTRAVETHVDERACRAEDAGEVRPAHDAVGRAVLFEYLEGLLTVPAWVAELDGRPLP